MKIKPISFKAEQYKIKVPKTKKGNHKNYYRDQLKRMRKGFPTL